MFTIFFAIRWKKLPLIKILTKRPKGSGSQLHLSF
ncbi:Uncharacterised protein [Burkholderia pseudomallei]|nr:Uncharacterised protein [Burkholderia pseudomallei]